MKLRKPRFTILQCLAITLVCALACTGIALWKRRGYEQRKLVEKLENQEVAVSYKLQSSGLLASVAKTVGPDMVVEPKEFFVNSPQNQSVPMNDLLTMKSAEHLALNTSGVTDDDLKRLTELPNLKHLNLSSTTVSDAGIANLVDLNLISLHIQNLAITDGCIESLGHIKSLKWISVTKGTFSADAIERLQDTLPQCTINLAN